MGKSRITSVFAAWRIPPPTQGQWNAFYARLIRLISIYEDRQDDAGRFVRRLLREIECLWTFLVEEGVAPTNNHAERMLRFAGALA